jgi:hypothetical protein
VADDRSSVGDIAMSSKCDPPVSSICIVFIRVFAQQIRGDRKAGGFGGATPNNSIRRGPQSTAVLQQKITSAAECTH